MDTSDDLLTLGWREFVGLPDLRLPALRAKVDTGARTSALHAFRLEEFSQKGQAWVRFWLHPLRNYQHIVHETSAPIVDRRVVSDSGGHRQKRIVIETTVTLGDRSWSIEVTLSNRDTMMFPMLLGRTAMEGRALVDPAGSFLMGREAGHAYRQTLLDANPSP